LNTECDVILSVTLEFLYVI